MSSWQGQGSSSHWEHRTTSSAVMEQTLDHTEKLCLNPQACFHDPSHLHSLVEKGLRSQLMNQKLIQYNNDLVLNVPYINIGYLCTLAQQGLGSIFH